MHRHPARAALGILIGVAALSCQSHTTTEPVTKGRLHFAESGCACVYPPYPTRVVYIDGKPSGTLPTFGSLDVEAAPGEHTWAIGESVGTAKVTAAETTGVHLRVNLGCADPCAADPPAR